MPFKAENNLSLDYTQDEPRAERGRSAI